MAKIKNKKRLSADRVQARKELLSKKKSLNPFEVHINKEKLRVIGKKEKNDRGLPGVSRAKAIEKRKRTLLQEYKVKNKSNKFMDKRIGEKNPHMTDEDKVMARFTAVRVKAHKKKSIYNLADDEVLTHRGQTLNEIEKFDDPRSEDEEDDEERGNLDKQFVEDAHFGGGVLKKTGIEGAKSHKDLIDQLIAESKKRKAEKQKTKEATLELTEKLDSEWKDLLPLVNKSKKIEEEITNKSKVDDYDKVMRELKFEARGTVSDRLKTEDEIAKEEREKLEQLEKERLDRMKGIVEEKIPMAQHTHRSADDLDDNFVYESDTEYVLSYNEEGQSNVQVDAEINGKSLGEDIEKSVDEEKLDNEEVSGEEDESEESDTEDNLSDLKEISESESESDTEEKNKKKISNKDTNTVEKETEEGVLIKNQSQKTELNNEEKQVVEKNKSQIKETMELAKNEIPYVLSLPESYEDLQKMFRNQSIYHQSVIIERLIKCHHPSLAEGNKDNLGLLFAYLLQYLNDLFSDALNEESIKNSFETFKILVPQIYDLAQLNSENTHNSILEVIKEKHEEYKKPKKEYPGFEILMFLKLISLLFSTSDFRHQIVTPCFMFVEQMLFKCKVKSKRDISYGLFLTTLILEYSTLSKRYLPATINFLSGILHMAIPKTGVRLISVPPPFKSTVSLLVLIENCSLEQFPSLQMTSSDLLDDEIEEKYKVRVLYSTIKLLQEFYNNFQELPSCLEIFELVSKYMQLIPINNYPKEVSDAFEGFFSILKKGQAERKLQYVVMEAKKPKALRLYEPKIEEVYDGKRKFKVQSKEKAERDKLIHKLKREKKGALREIRRDQDFLGRVKISQKIKSDVERREKVKRIYAEAAMQQSELNELDRKKKRKK